MDIWNFFHDETIRSMHYDALKRCMGDGVGAKVTKNSLDFSNKFGSKYKDLYDDRGIMIQPRIISKICDILCENNMLSKMHVSGFNLSHGENFYCGFGKEQIPVNVFNQRYFNNIVYGFKYIYEANKINVLPVYVRKNITENGVVEEKFYTGTCFKSSYGVVTAKHCITNCNAVSIPGIKSAILKEAKIFSQDGVDLVVIVPELYDRLDVLKLGSGEVLDSTMSMGYPNHAGFGNFLTATTGQIAAIEKSYLCPAYELMLLTGKIKGGNSGGPVLDKRGNVIGVITETADPEGDYDKFGYGMAIPSDYIEKIVKNAEEYTEKINFVDSI